MMYGSDQQEVSLEGGHSTDVAGFFGGARAAASGMHAHVGVSIDSRIPNDETLSKGGALGKFVAKHRKAVINVASLLALVAATLIVYQCAAFVFYSVRFVLAAILHEIAAIFSWRTAVQTVNENAVINVVEPSRCVTDVYRTALLLRDIASEQSNPSAPLTHERVTKLRYAPWSLANMQGRYNFTFDSLERTMSAYHNSCKCFAEYGVPYNAVFGLGEGNLQDFFYDVRIDSERCVPAEAQPIEHPLLSLAIDVMTATSDDAAKTAAGLAQLAQYCSAGAVVDALHKESGKRRRVKVAGAKLECAKACALLFDPEFLKFLN